MRRKAMSIIAVILVFGLSFSAVRMAIPDRTVKESGYAATESDLEELSSTEDTTVLEDIDQVDAEEGTDDSSDDLSSQDGTLSEDEEAVYNTDEENTAPTDEPEPSEETDAPATADQETIQTLTAEGEDYTVTATYGAEAEIPENAQLQVTPIDPESELYQARMQEAQEKLSEEAGENVEQNLTLFQLYDIAFMADGQEIEPAAPVQVALNFKAAEELVTPENANVIHFDEEQGAEIIENPAVNADQQEGTVTAEFEAERFSEYAVCYTQISTHVITADGEDYIITVTYGPEAEIPDGAILEANEIAIGSSDYETYLEQSLEKLGLNDSYKATEERPWTISVPMARFFDVSIILDEKKIEPKAPVSVEISYVGNENAHLGAMSVVHFADSGLEIIHGTMSGGEDGTTVSFEQSSFSVTGTIINSANLAEDDYYILKEDNGRWHALASDGGTVDVTEIYDPASSSVVNYRGVKNITWEVSFTDLESDGGDGWYYIKAKGEDKYISLNGSIVSGTPTYLYVQGTTWSNTQGIWISHWYDDVVNDYWGRWWYTDHFTQALGWDGTKYYYKQYATSRDTNYGRYNYPAQYPSEVRFAKVTGDSEVVNSNWPNNTYNEAQIQSWLDQAMTDKPLQDVNKKASIYDYDNRIYQIDFSARSGVTAMAADLSMAFVTDVSNSMLFPANLTPISGKTNIDLKSGNLDSLPHNNGQVYFTIADAKASSTVYALYYDNGWKGMDSSYYAKWKAGVTTSKPTDKEKSIGSSTTYLHTNDNATNKTKYTIYTGNSEWLTGINHRQIYDMSDNGAYGLQPDGSMTSYNMGNRLYYLESSVASAVNDMQIIAKEYPLGAVYAGLETFAAERVKTQEYLKIGGYQNNMDTANTVYANNVKTIFNELKNITGQDGTDQRDAFDGVPYIGNGVALPNGTNKYVIMITDGAPNKCTTAEAIASAKALKQAGYTIITVGLSTKDVSVAPEMLWKSASFVDPNVNIDSTDKSKAKYYYYAESGEDLKWILRDVVRNAMGQATVTSTVTDTIDPLFYPVANTVPIATPARTFSHSLPEFEPNSAGQEPNFLYNGYGTPCA